MYKIYSIKYFPFSNFMPIIFFIYLKLKENPILQAKEKHKKLIKVISLKDLLITIWKNENDGKDRKFFTQNG